MKASQADIDAYTEVLKRGARWRLNNLYSVMDKDLNLVRFRMWPRQEKVLNEMHNRNIVLKARQLGMTLFIQLFMLDNSLFRKNVKCGVVAHNVKDASNFFAEKIRFTYRNLPEFVRNVVPSVNDSSNRLELENGSVITCGTSLRGRA